MFRKMGLLLSVFFVLSAAIAVASEDVASESEAKPEIAVEGQATPHDEASANDRIHWDFITCVHTTHECSHEAQYHGYHHYKAVHDHHLCHGHAHLACYGGHH